MSLGSSIRAGSAFVEVTLRDGAFVRNLNRAQAKLRAFSAGVQALGRGLLIGGGALAGVLAVATGKFMKWGDTLDKMSQRTGVTVEDLSELSFAAEQSGTSVDVLEKALRGMQRGLFDAKRGAGEMKDAMAELGLTWEDLDGLSPADQLQKLFEKMKGIEDPTIRAGVAMKLFGRSGAEILPMIDNLSDLRAEAKRLGITMKTEDAAAAAALTDAWNRLKRVLTAGSVAIGAALAPALNDLAGRITRVVIASVGWLEKNRGLVVTIAKLAPILIGAGLAVIFLGKAFAFSATLIGAFSTAVSITSAVVSSLAFLFTPIGATIAVVTLAIVELTAAFLYFSGYGSKILSWLGDRWDGFKVRALNALGGVRDALLSGDIGLAAKIMWKALHIELMRGFNAFDEIISKIASRVIKLLNVMKLAFPSLAVAIKAGLLKPLEEIANGRPMRAALQDLTIVAEEFLLKDLIAKAQAARAKSEAGAGTPPIAPDAPPLPNLEGGGTSKDDVLRRLRDAEISLAQARSDRSIMDRINTAIEANPVQAEAMLQEMLTANKKAAADLNAQYRQAVADAFADGTVTDAEQQNLDDLFRTWQSAEGWTDKLGGSIDQAKTAIEQMKLAPNAMDKVAKRIEARGTFSSAVLSQMGLGSSIEERLADSNDKIERNTRQIETLLRDGKALFV